MIIDVHTHLADERVFSQSFLDGVVGDYPDANLNPLILKALIKKTLSDYDCKKFIAQMDEAGIDKSVLLMTDFGYEEDMNWEELFQRYLAVIKQYPDRIIPFWGCDCRREGNYKYEFEKSIKEYNFKGIKLYPPCGFDLNDSKMLPYYEICQSYNVPVLTHTGASNSDMYNEYDYIQQLGEVIKLFPGLKIIMAHVTTEGFEKRVEFCKQNRNVYCDLSAFQKEAGSDKLVKKLTILENEIPDQILFGTDWPLYSLMGTQKKWVDYFKNSQFISEEFKEKIFSKNFLNIMEN